MHIDKVIITYGRMRAIVSFEPDEERFTDERIAALALEMHPLLRVHSCINSKGPTFGAVIGDTTKSHLLEHMVIAEQTEMAKDKGIEDATFVGFTHWVDEEKGIAEVQVSFLDDLDATKALSDSLAAIEGFCERSQ